jgi:hypothetical protein
MSRLSALAVLALGALTECNPSGRAPALRAGDTARPQLAVTSSWPAGGKAAVGMFVEVHRPGRRDAHFLRERDVPDGAAAMRATVTFFAGDETLGAPLTLPFVRDC